jgi:hypothetical protein
MSKILIKFPTRARHDKFHSVLQKYIDFASSLENIQIIVSVDDDDEPERYKSLHTCVKIVVGKHSTKIDAINRDMPDPSEFDILLLASDDMIPIKKGYDTIIREKMSEYFPDGDGVLFFNDKYRIYKINTLVICGSKYYQRFNYIYYPEYISLFCDNEFMDEANKLGRQIYFHDVIIQHEHPQNNVNIPLDRQYITNINNYNKTDKELYYKRRITYDISILICTIPSRISLFVKLLNRINILKRTTKLLVEILFDDDTTITVGEKRNKLVLRSNGTYCCFVDDDDDITDDYFSVIEESGLTYDCISLNGKLFVDGKYHLPFYHSMQYKQWTEDNKGYYRSPNHLNPIKTSIVKQITFPDISEEEDHSFSKKLVKSGLIQTEFQHTKIQYIYYFANKKRREHLTPKIRLGGFKRYNKII